MGAINICNSAGRDAVVTTESIGATKTIRWVDSNGRQASNIRVIKSSIDRDVEALTEQSGGELNNVAQTLIDSDAEIDLELTGRFVAETSRIYVNQDRQIVHKVQPWEIIRKPDGTERERRPRTMLPPNITGEVPLNWSGVFIKKDAALRRFVFVSKVQLMHINGLTFDFLFGMAKELEEKESMMLLGAGPKSNQPLILRRGGRPYRGFLDGRTQGDKYCLLLHYSDLELKAPTESDGAND